MPVFLIEYVANMRIGVLVCAVMLLPACNSSEPVPTNTSTAGEDSSVVSTQLVGFLGLKSSVPGNWQSIAPSSNMRLAQYAIPGELNAEMIVYYFGPTQGGTAEANINRWVSQFRTVSDQPVKPLISNFKTTGGFDVTWVELQGEYARGVGSGPVGKFQSNQKLIAAITRTHKGNLYIQLHGDVEVVNHHQDDFLIFVKGLRQEVTNG